MPTSNGLVTSRDIRQAAVKTVHVQDEAIVTAKIPDLAITYPDKIDNPIYVASAESARFHNVSLTTTNTEWASLEFEIPAWVNQIYVFTVATAQMTNSSGGSQLLIIWTGYNGVTPVDAQGQAIVNGTTGSVAHVASVSDVGWAGSTFTCEIWAEVGSGTNSSNNGEINAFLIGTR